MFPAASPASPPPELRPHGGLALARRGALTQLLCLAIALLLTLLGEPHGHFGVTWLYSALIGTSCWLCIDLGRMAAGQALARAAPQHLPRWSGIAAIVASVLAGSLAGYSIGAGLGDLLTGHRTPSVLASPAMLAVTLAAGIVATYFFYSIERLAAQRAATEHALRLAAEHRLKLLESQLEPHMLFNTLANLRVLIGLDAPRAQAMLDHLNAYLRATLGASRAGALQPLAAEFARLSDYLALMAVRMGTRLAVRLDLPAALRDAPVPPLLLQPLVENAIQHGLEPKVEGGRLEVSARRDGSSLVLAVRDTGVGLGPARPGGGFGTQQVRERLEVLYGPDAALFTLAAAADGDGGTLATIRLPLDLPAPAAP